MNYLYIYIVIRPLWCHLQLLGLNSLMYQSTSNIQNNNCIHHPEKQVKVTKLQSIFHYTFVAQISSTECLAILKCSESGLAMIYTRSILDRSRIRSLSIARVDPGST
jgi:hypothetical protein